MVYSPVPMGFPSSTAICAPAGTTGGAGPHWMSFGIHAFLASTLAAFPLAASDFLAAPSLFPDFAACAPAYTPNASIRTVIKVFFIAHLLWRDKTAANTISAACSRQPAARRATTKRKPPSHCDGGDFFSLPVTGTD